MENKVIRTSCPRDCFGGCTMKVHVEGGRIVRVEGESSNRASGGILCSKGLSYADYVYSPDRVGYPKERVGDRGQGVFRSISWDEAVEKIGLKLKEIKKEYGPLGVMHYSSGGCQGMLSEYYMGFFSQYGGYSTTRGNLCYSAGIEAVKLTYGEVKHNAPWDMENAGLIILWGKNPANTNIQEMKLINDALSRGCRLITVDPIRTGSSLKSSLHISLEPGTDGVLALCIINLLIQHDKVDMEFVKNHTSGFDMLKYHVQKYDLSSSSKICRVDEGDILKMAELIESSRPLTLICGYGLQRYINGGQTVRAISMIPALLGDVGIRGGGFRFANKQWRNLDWPYIPDCENRIRDDYTASRLGKAIEEYENPGVHMLWVERANPMAMNPDINGLKRAFEKLDFIVAVDQFMTDTTNYADLVLPAQSFFEYTDIFAGYWTPYISLCQKAIDPVGESRNESEIYRMLGQYMGYDMKYLPSYDEGTLNEILRKSGTGVTVKMLKQGPYMREGSEIAFADRKFNTPSGRIELYSEAMHDRWGQSPLPQFEPDGAPGQYPLRFLSTHDRDRIHSQSWNTGKTDSKSIAVLHMNTFDAQCRGITDGEEVFIYNGNGSIHAVASVSNMIKEGTVNLHEGLPQKSGSCANMLTYQNISDIGYGAPYYDCFVEVEKCLQ